MKFFSEMFAEHSGKPSASRALSAFVCMCVIGTWTYISIVKAELQALSTDQVVMVLGAMGLKAWQRGKERAEKPNQTQETKGPQ